MRIIDTHCHLAQSEFSDDLGSVIHRASDKKVVMISSAINPKHYSQNIEISRRYPIVHASLGLDPTAFQDAEIAVDKIGEHIDSIVAIGETGLDHYIIRDHSERDEQESAFRKMIQLAQEENKPIQIHSRSAGRKAVEVLSSMDADRVHMHAFDGKASIARSASRNLGYYFSIPTSVVRSPQKQKLVKAVDIERLLLETDSPVLGPDKGERNEPSNIWIALREVAKILRMNEEELREIVIENTLRLYTDIKSK